MTEYGKGTIHLAPHGIRGCPMVTWWLSTGRGRFTRLLTVPGGVLRLPDDWVREGDDSPGPSRYQGVSYGYLVTEYGKGTIHLAPHGTRWCPTVTWWLSTGRGRFTCLILGQGVSYGYLMNE